MNARADPAPVVLFYTDNGLGLGHLTRQAAVATRAGSSFRPVFLTMSAGFTLLRGLDLAGEYFPSYGRLGIPKHEWEPMVAERLLEAIRLTEASLVVVDHVSPPRIFAGLRHRAPGVQFVWSRRGLWQPGKNQGPLTMSEDFDLVVEPGDVASPVDQGPTVAWRRFAHPLAPVILTHRSQFADRETARAALGIPATGRAVLISLGDADPEEVGRLIAHTRSVVDSLVSEPIHYFAPLHPLHGASIPQTTGVIMRPVYPIARFFNAFDGVVSTAGYNSFHEIVASGLPAVFVPHRGAKIDDQARRAEFAALSGRAQWAPSVDDEEFRQAVKQMLRPGEAKIARKTTELLGEMDGADQFAALLGDLATRGPARTIGDEHDTVPGGGEPGQGAGKTLITALEHKDDQLLGLAESVGSGNLENVVYLVRDGDPRPLYGAGAVFESVMTEEEWSRLVGGEYQSYLDARISGIKRRYGITRIIPARPGVPLQLGDLTRSAG